MKAIAARRISSAPTDLPAVFNATTTIQNLRRLIWLYLVLLILEGALRKWIVPQLSTPLLLVRDPVVVAIYVLALRARLFPLNFYVVSLLLLAILSWVTGILVLLPVYSLHAVILVTGYGVRSDFLHLPLLFVIPAVFDLEDVKRVGRWTIVGMIPMALLMAVQFAASPDSFINRVAGGGEGLQIQAGSGKVRPPAVFSFVSGTIYYLSAATAFLLHAILARLPYKTWLLYASAAGLILGLGVSGSRSTVLAVLLVVVSMAAILAIRPSLVSTFGRHLLLAVTVIWAISYLPIFQEGLRILSDRFIEAAEVSESSVLGGLVNRTIFGFSEGLRRLPGIPLGGYGLGVGTSGGASFLTGEASFLLAENEWSRILLESGPILGLAFLLWRCALACKLGFFAVRQTWAGNTLPMFLFSAGVFVILQGPFGQPTSLGFAVVLGGLCLAARTRQPAVPAEPDFAPDDSPAGGQRVQQRSKYAERLHGSIRRSHSAHGPLDR